MDPSRRGINTEPLHLAPDSVAAVGALDDSRSLGADAVLAGAGPAAEAEPAREFVTMALARRFGGVLSRSGGSVYALALKLPAFLLVLSLSPGLDVGDAGEVLLGWRDE